MVLYTGTFGTHQHYWAGCSSSNSSKSSSKVVAYAGTIRVYQHYWVGSSNISDSSISISIGSNCSKLVLHTGTVRLYQHYWVIVVVVLVAVAVVVKYYCTPASSGRTCIIGCVVGSRSSSRWVKL